MIKKKMITTTSYDSYITSYICFGLVGLCVLDFGNGSTSNNGGNNCVLGYVQLFALYLPTLPWGYMGTW